MDEVKDAIKIEIQKVYETYIENKIKKNNIFHIRHLLLHAASCGTPIWYKNIPDWSQHYSIYAIDLIGECSKSSLTKKMKTRFDNAKWLDETIVGLNLQTAVLCGLSIRGWNAANYAGFSKVVEKRTSKKTKYANTDYARDEVDIPVRIRIV